MCKSGSCWSSTGLDSESRESPRARLASRAARPGRGQISARKYINRTTRFIYKLPYSPERCVFHTQLGDQAGWPRSVAFWALLLDHLKSCENPTAHPQAMPLTRRHAGTSPDDGGEPRRGSEPGALPRTHDGQHTHRAAAAPRSPARPHDPATPSLTAVEVAGRLAG